MVCQAASQTRFRALKHEHGISGRTTIIVRIIACFQPLQNCQAEYFRQLLKPDTKYTKYSGCSLNSMFRAKESQACKQFSAWTPPDLDRMAPLPLEQNYSLPCFPKTTYTADVAFPGCDLNTVQQDSLKRQPPNWDILYPTKNPYFKDSKCDLPHKPIDGFCALQKRFLIFDQSGNHTRLFVSPSLSPQNQTFTSNVINGLCEKVEDPAKNQLVVKPVIEEKWDENDLDVEEGEMLEDSDEINALLYSDSDDDEYDDDDEVTSTGHTPFIIGEGFYDKDKLLNELTEEVASSDDLPKRQRLLDGRYKIPSLDDVESSFIDDKNSYDYIDSSKREKKVKIREALKILESIIPGLKNEDPLSIIDNAIVYLKSMKNEAKDLGLSYQETFTSG